MNNEELSVYLWQEWAVDVPSRLSMEELVQKLTARINELLDRDMDRFFSLLYTIDISEKKLSILLKENEGVDSGRIIALLIIERQLQKIKSRKEFKTKEDPSSEEERW